MRHKSAQVNSTETDKTTPPSLLARSLALVNLELSASRVASTSKLRQAFEKRSEDNATASGILHNNQHLWETVGGPSPDSLFRPSAAGMEKARQSCETLQRMKQIDDSDGLSEFVQEISKAVDMLKSAEWDDIRKEKFFLTPPALFSDLVRTAESLISRQAAEITRRKEWLGADADPEQDRDVPIKPSTADKYGIDLEEFKMKTGRKPREWKKALRIATWLQNRHIHETG